MNYLFDENVSHRLVELMAKCAAPGILQHVVHKSLRGATDLQIVQFCVSGKYILVTGDRNDKTRGCTLEELKNLGIRIILLGKDWDHMKLWDKTRWLIHRWDTIYENTHNMPEGSCATIMKSGKIKFV